MAATGTPRRRSGTDPGSSISPPRTHGWRPWFRSGYLQRRGVGHPIARQMQRRPSAVPPSTFGGPRLQPVDDQQQGKGEQEHHYGDRGGAGVVVLLQLGDN